MQVLNAVRVNTSAISESADEGTIFLNVRKALAAIPREAQKNYITKGNKGNAAEKESVTARFTAFMNSCGLSAAARPESWVSQMKAMVYWDCAGAFEKIMKYPWVRTSFKVSWAKSCMSVRLDPVRHPFQKFSERPLILLQYLISILNEIENKHYYIFREAAEAVTTDDLKMFTQLKKAVSPTLKGGPAQDVYQGTLLKIMFPSRAELPPVPGSSDEVAGAATSVKEAGSRSKIIHRGPQFDAQSFQDKR